MRILNHLKIWNQWRKRSLNSKFYKLLVLIGAMHSPTFNAVAQNEKYKNMWNIF